MEQSKIDVGDRLLILGVRQINLKIQLDISGFLRKEVLYLAYTIISDGLKPNNDQIKLLLAYSCKRE